MIDIFAGYGWVITQILSLAGIVALIIQSAKWLEKRNVSRDWYIFILTIVVIVSMQVFSIFRFDQQSDQLNMVEQQNRQLNLQQLKAQNITLLNQGLIRHALNESHVDSRVLLADNILFKKAVNNTVQSEALIKQTLKDLQFHIENQSKDNDTRIITPRGQAIIS